ncbi:MAG: ABC transporter permease [Anaerolineaceae bacterium]
MNKMKSKKNFLKRCSKNYSMMIGVIVLFIILIVVLSVPIFSHTDPNKINYESMLQSPSVTHIMGTDSFGRDLFTRVATGGRISIAIGLEVMLGTTVLGVLIALLAGYNDKFDMIVMRLMDVMMSFPSLLLAIALTAVFSNSIEGVSIALTIAYVPRTVRILRSSILTLREETYVEAAQAIGVKPITILFKHILPGTLPVLIVQETFLFAYAILAEAGISFVGVGVQPPDASWGNILSDATTLLHEAPWTVMFPGLAIMLTVLALNLIGDGLREVLDPKRLKGNAND